MRCKSVSTMTRWYIDVLGATPEWLDRFNGTLSHVRVGDSLIDLLAMDAAFAFATDEPDVAKSTLDHLSLRCEDFDVDQAMSWFASFNVEVVTSGARFGADGSGFSIYVRDPEGNVVELKCGDRELRM